MKNTIIKKPGQKRKLTTSFIFFWWLMCVLVIIGSPGCKKPIDKTIKLDHFLVYDIAIVDPFQEVPVEYKGQFDDEFKPDMVLSPQFFANPVKKNSGAYYDSTAHLVWYYLTPKHTGTDKWYMATNQFGNIRFKVDTARYLLVPTEKRLDPIVKKDDKRAFPADLDHFVCYDIKQKDPIPGYDGTTKELILKDQFLKDTIKIRLKPRYFCVPVKKRVDGKQPKDLFHEELHLTVYIIEDNIKVDTSIFALNQFTEKDKPYPLDVTFWKYLCVPTWDKKESQ